MRTDKTDLWSGRGRAVFASILFNLGLFFAAMPLAPVRGAQVSIPGCPGTSVEIANRTFNTGDTASCQATVDITMGPDVTVSTLADVALCAPTVVLSGPVTIASGALFSVQTTACQTGGTSNQAVLGSLSGAEISAYRLTDLENPVEGPFTAATSESDLSLAGTFSLSLVGIPDDEWILVTASSGLDIDADDDGVVDTSPTQNLGTMHALAKARDWRLGGLYISSLTDIVWRYTQNLVGAVPPDELVIRLNDLSQRFVKYDVDGSGTVDWLDILFFSPADSTHHAKLNFDYQLLFELDEASNSIIQAIHDGDEALLGHQLDLHFGQTLTRFPVPDIRYTSIKVDVSLFGGGSVVSDGTYGINVDSEQPAENNITYFYAPRNPTETVTLTATPTSETEILGWRGCDSVTADLSQCSVSFNANRAVVASFGYTTSELAGPVHDLSNATNTLTTDSIDVVIAAGDDALVAALAGMQVEEFVVGSTGGGFLRKVTAITGFDDHHYLLGTSDATLEEVVVKGTFSLVKTLTNGDLQGFTAQVSGSGPATVAKAAFEGLPGVRLVPSSDPADPVFHILFGELGAGNGMEPKSALSGEVSLGDGVTANGSLDIEIDLDAGASFAPGLFGLPGKLEDFRFITDVDSTQSLTLTVSGERSFNAEQMVGELRFAPMVFAIGPCPTCLPVWITPKIPLYLGADGSVEAALTTGIELSQEIYAGVVYSSASGFSTIGILHPTWSPSFPATNVKASLQGFIRTEPILHIYDATGPALPAKAYVELNSEAAVGTWGDDSCGDSFKMNFIAGLESEFQWNLSGDTKLGEFLHLDQLQDKTTIGLMDREWLLKSWHIGRAYCYTKIDADGYDLPDIATEWECVRDDNTGLIWEKKTDDNGLRDGTNSYSWFDPNPATNGGFEGCINPSQLIFDEESQLLVCEETFGWCPQADCNTQTFTAAVNAISLCGNTDWRVPSHLELGTLVYCSNGDYNLLADPNCPEGSSSPTIPIEYFPFTSPWFNWSSTALETPPGYNGNFYKSRAQAIQFSDGWYWGSPPKSLDGAIRLVHGGL